MNRSNKKTEGGNQINETRNRGISDIVLTSPIVNLPESINITDTKINDEQRMKVDLVLQSNFLKYMRSEPNSKAIKKDAVAGNIIRICAIIGSSPCDSIKLKITVLRKEIRIKILIE
ncbi:hypothetical protein QA601_05580 [Chitinispirillales bacterium ANBcel5]|uniref:hypothetical protein n=1 Tax=Cellulosispirillum alkaliphilum TaxID=3039283 RepID=UPI002A537800|nr:hypothetical protein [Chitinispirillales bacterium ANBcel5]